MNGLIDTQLYFGIPNQQPVGEDEDEEAIGWIGELFIFYISSYIPLDILSMYV